MSAIERVIAVLQDLNYNPAGYAYHTDPDRPLDPTSSTYTHIGLNGACRVVAGGDDELYRWLMAPHVGARYGDRNAAVAALRATDPGPHPWGEQLRRAVRTGAFTPVYAVLQRIPDDATRGRLVHALTVFGCPALDFGHAISILQELNPEQLDMFLELI